MSPTSPTPIAPPLPTAALLNDLAQLSPTDRLIRHKDYEVWLATAPCIPAVLNEIGRLRETAFRSVGEGTGKALDLDEYDAWYKHLFIWHVGRQEVIGAYRLGFSEDILPEHGLTGFYTHRLFEYDEAFIRALSPCIEPGRSFVRLEDQRSFLPLLLLWRGMATIASRDPRYRRLFGPVSISADIPPIFRFVLAESLLRFHGSPELAARVRPRRPLAEPVFKPDLLAGLADEDSLESWLARRMPDARVPVLIRQYLTLNGRLLAFSVDPDFNHSLDGLVLVDLDRVEEQTLGRYMGADAARQFLNLTDNCDERIAVSEPRAA